jgi:hypothetical protein
MLLPHNIQRQWQPMHPLTSPSKLSSPSSGHITGTEVNYCHEGHGYHHGSFQHGAELGKISFHSFLTATPHKMKNSLCVSQHSSKMLHPWKRQVHTKKTSKYSYAISLANKTDTNMHKDDRNAYYCSRDRYNETVCWKYKNAPFQLKHTYLPIMFCIQTFFS